MNKFHRRIRTIYLKNRTYPEDGALLDPFRTDEVQNDVRFK